MMPAAGPGVSAVAAGDAPTAVAAAAEAVRGTQDGPREQL